MSNRKSFYFTRREFLKAAGVSAVALAGAPLLSSCGAFGGGASGPLKIGLLVPTSGNFGGYGSEITNGIKLWVDSMGGEIAGRPVEYVQEDTEGNPEVGLQKARKLVEQDNVDVMTGIVSSGVLMACRDYLHEAQKMFIVANAGANPISRGAKSPYIWRASFSNWMMGAKMGEWTANNVGKKAVGVFADYTAGHNERDSFVYHYTEAGGTIEDLVMVPFPGMGDPAPIIADLANKDADFFYIFLPGGAGIGFFQAAVDFDLMSQIPMYANNAQTSEDILRVIGDPAEGIISSWLWGYVNDIPENNAFIEAYEGAYGLAPSSFSVQGYDAARVISTMLERVEGDTSDVDAMVGAMSGISFASPRGSFVLDEATQNPRQDWYLREVVRHTDGELHNKVLENLGEVVDPGDDSKG
ncbi:MAG: ABC transporter substrate-binding protein [Chloroflexota bacterium]